MSWTNLPGGGLGFTLRSDMDESLYIIARLAENGPILDNARVDGLTYDTTAYGTLVVVQTYGDGSQLVEVLVTLNMVPPNLQIVYDIFVGGVTFEDGTLTLTVTASDFDELGQFKYRLIRGAGVTTSVCHTTDIYDGVTKIGVQ